MVDQEEIHNQCFSEDPKERIKALGLIKENFSLLLDKQQAWNDLIRLTNDEDSYVKSEVAYALRYAFSHIPDKQQAWNDLHRLTNDEDSDVRSRAVYVLDSAFSQVPNKQQAWNDLIQLTNDDDWSVRSRAAEALGSAIPQAPDKQQAWNDLIQLTNDDDWNVRFRAAYALNSAFSQVQDKQQAWNDLIQLTNYEDGYVRFRAAYTLGSVFYQIPDKQQAWNDLIQLTNDKDDHVRICANHSLGKVSIFKASQSEKEEEYKRELETAISFFEKAAHESKRDNPSQFCLPFYRSFHTIIFKKQEANEEVHKYLEEAKNAIEGSKSKELLFDAVQNLAEALKEVQSLGNLDLSEMKDELNFYRKYCDRAAELMKCTDEKAPFATEVLRKGLPILDRDLKELIEEIQKKAKIACRNSIGSDTEEIACTINQEVQKWEIGSQQEMTFNIENLVFTLESNIPRIPANQYIFDRILQIREQKDIVKQYGIVCTIIPLVPRLHMEKGISDIKKVVDEVNEKADIIIIKLDEIQKELTKGFEKLDLLSSEIGGKEGELIENFSKKIHELIEKRDKETLCNFLEEIHEKENTLTEEIEKSSVPLEEKEESKRCILNIGSVLDKVKHPIKSFGKNVTNEIIVSYTAKETVKLVFQLVSIAALGFPIPTPILNLLSSMVENL